MAHVLINDGTSQREVELSDPITIAGRSSENKIHIEDKQASRKHCQIEKAEHGFKLVDLESRNGTRVNDRVVNQALLRPGDRITIGKHTITFVDPAFKEPPADVAARFAPPPPSAPVPMAPAPVVSPAPSAAADPEPRIRRRTGHTTSMAIERVARVDRAKEQKMLRTVGIGAGAFILILVVLIIIPSGGESPVGKLGREDYEKAVTFYGRKQFDQARISIARIPAGEKVLYDKGQGLLRSIDDAEKKIAANVSDAEKRDFDALYEFCDKNRANPTTFDRMFGMCSDFKQKYPLSKSLGPVDEFLKISGEGRKGNRNKELNDGIAAAQEEYKKSEFGLAIKRVNGLVSKFTDEVDSRERLVKLHDEIAEKGVEHYQAKRAEAKELIARNMKVEAIKIYEALTLALGDVEEFSVQAQVVKTSLQGLK